MKNALWILLALFLMGFNSLSYAEEETGDETSYYSEESEEAPPPPPVTEKPKAKRLKGKGRRKYFVPDTSRSDAGLFHVAIAAGGNFYIEPAVNRNTNQATGNYFKDFGFQGGVYFDYDYSALTENVPLGLRGMVGYKYILSSVHQFTFDALARYMFRVSDKSTFGLGLGTGVSLWYRAQTSSSPTEQFIFLPSAIIGAGFEFNPFMADFKWCIQRFGDNNTIMGWELYFGLRL